MRPKSTRPRTIGSLMFGLARLGILGFGGVGPQAYYFFVEQSGWLTADEFAERYSIAQALPGANVVNLCAILGDRWFGPIGAIAAVSAITVPPLVVVLIAASAIAHVTRSPRFVAAESAVVAASAGLIVANAYRVLSTVSRRRIGAVVIAFAVAFAVGAHAVSMPTATLAAGAVAFGIDFLMRTRP